MAGFKRRASTLTAIFPPTMRWRICATRAIFPRINRADYAVTIYPPVAEFFFLIVTRIGENVNVMRLALLGCEAVSVTLVMLFLRRMERPTTRVVAYFWHPLPIWEIANNGHVDALAVALMLLGLWVALTGRAMRGAVLIALGTLVKPYVAPAFAPIWRPWDWKMPLAVIAVIALCYLPYLSVGSGVFGFLTKGYLTEEGIISGDDLWLLSIWRLVFGAHQRRCCRLCSSGRLDPAVYGAFGRRAAQTGQSHPALRTPICCYWSSCCCCRQTILGIFWQSCRLSHFAAMHQPGQFQLERSC